MCPKVCLGCYTVPVFAIVCPCSLCQTPFPGQQKRYLVLCHIQLLFCLKAKIASVQPLPFLKPICAWLRNGSTLSLARFSRTLAYILPMWLSREMPLYIPQSLLLPFFFCIGTMTARCQSSGTFLSIHAFWKMEVGQVMPISPLARMASVVIPSIPGHLFLGLVSIACWTSDLRMVGSSSLSLLLGWNWDWFCGFLWVLFNSSLKYSFHLVLVSFLSLMGLSFWSLIIVVGHVLLGFDSIMFMFCITSFCLMCTYTHTHTCTHAHAHTHAHTHTHI